MHGTMMQPSAHSFWFAHTLAQKHDKKRVHDTPTVRARVTPAGEMLSEASVEELDSGEVARYCKACMESGPDDAEYCAHCGAELATFKKMPDPYLGTTVGGKYRIDHKIGQGGMGVVYQGINDELGQRVAVKFLSGKFADDPSIVLRFLNEAKSYCRVSHPNAVTLLEYGQHEDGALYIITEFIEGANVTQTLKAKGPLDAETVLEVGLQVAEVLSAAHGQGVIHRDLKPDNIMLIPSSRGRYAVKVLDFGIAKIVDEEHGPTTETGSVFGTPEFMAPEQARGDVADQRSDIYALGIILFYMLTGKLPFMGKNKLIVLNKQLNEDPPRPSSLVVHPIPPKLEAVVMKCLNKKRSSRYDNADDLLEALEELRVPGGLATGRVGKSSAKPSELVTTTETVRVATAGDDEEVTGFADTLAAPLDLGRPLQLAELESIEMSREYGADTGRVASASSRTAPIAVFAVALVGVVAVGAFLYRSAPAPTDTRLEEVMLEGQTVALLETVDEMLAEGALESAAASLDKTDSWFSDAELDAGRRAERVELRRRLAELEAMQKKFDAAIASKDCWQANDMVSDVSKVSEGLAERMSSVAASCKAAVKPTKPEPPPAEPAAQEPEIRAVAPPVGTPRPATQEAPTPKTEQPKQPKSQPKSQPVVATPVSSDADGAPEPDPPRLGSSDDEESDSTDAADPEKAKENPDESMPAGMSLPPKTISE